MTNTVDTQNTKKRVAAFITPDAYNALDILSEILKDERKSGKEVSLIEAASIAIIETADRKLKAKERREARMAELKRTTRRATRAGATQAA